MSTFSIPIALLLLFQAAPAQVPLDPSTRSQATGLSRKIDQIRQRSANRATKRTPGTLQVTDAELNAWLRADPENRPKGVSEMTVRFEPQRLVARGLVDLSLLKQKMVISPWNPLAWISGIVPVDAAGRVESGGDGTATVVWDDVRVAAVPISTSMLRELVLSSTRGSRKYPGGLDITAPYPMPYDVRRVRLENSRALVDY